MAVVALSNINPLVMGGKNPYMNIFYLAHSSSQKYISSLLMVRFCREDTEASFSIFMGQRHVNPCYDSELNES